MLWTGQYLNFPRTFRSTISRLAGRRRFPRTVLLRSSILVPYSRTH